VGSSGGGGEGGREGGSGGSDGGEGRSGGSGGRFGDAQTSQLDFQPAISFAERPAWKQADASFMGVIPKALTPMLVTELPMAAEVRLEH